MAKRDELVNYRDKVDHFADKHNISHNEARHDPSFRVTYHEYKNTRDRVFAGEKLSEGQKDRYKAVMSDLGLSEIEQYAEGVSP